jgi:hypothetical protein
MWSVPRGQTERRLGGKCLLTERVLLSDQGLPATGELDVRLWVICNAGVVLLAALALATLQANETEMRTRLAYTRPARPA